MLVRVRRPQQVRRAELHPAEITEMPHPQFAVAARFRLSSARSTCDSTSALTGVP